MLICSRILVLVFLLLATVFGSCNKKNDGGDAIVPLPSLSIQEAIKARGTTDAPMRFYLYISKPSKEVVSVDYTLIDGSAKAGNDYVSASGTVSFPANETQATIDITIKGNPSNLRQPNMQFSVVLSNPKFCTIAIPTAKGSITTEDGTYLPTDNTGYSTPTSYPNYTLVWSDEFSANTLDPSIWNFETGNGNGGWGNNELEYYTGNLKNIFLSNGNLIIEARKESIGGLGYSSARITTQNKKHFKFGRIDIRAKLPVGKGIWPALWMLGANISTVGWPACGEIDIMELIGTYPARITGTMHWKPVSGTNTSKGSNYYLSAGDFSQQFHVFSLVWTKDTMSWYVDDQHYLTTTLSDVGAANYPFNAEQFFIFNVAVGGNWPGSPDETTSFPQRMFVDYIRVFQ